jgi:hypothetical protein
MRKEFITYKETLIRPLADCSAETCKARGTGRKYSAERKISASQNTLPTNLI